MGKFTNEREYQNIYLIDDYDIVNTYHRHLIHQVGSDAKITEFTDAVEALQFLNGLQIKKEPDLIFLDLVMPQIDGYELLEHLSNLTRKVYLDVAVVTAFPTNRLVEQVKGYDDLVKGIFLKPLRPQDVARILDPSYWTTIDKNSWEQQSGGHHTMG